LVIGSFLGLNAGVTSSSGLYEVHKGVLASFGSFHFLVSSLAIKFSTFWTAAVIYCEELKGPSLDSIVQLNLSEVSTKV
jgi:hypothetical protein